MASVGQWVDDPVHKGGWVDDPVVDHKARLAALQSAKGPGDSSLSSELAQTPLGGLVTGAAKGAASTAVGLGAIAHKLPGFLGQQSMAEIAPDQTEAFSGKDADINAATTADGTWQKVGKGAEQIGEFFVPGASEAGVLAPVAKAVGKAGVIGRAALEAANAGGVTAAQGGDAGTAAMVGGAMPLALKAVGAVAPRLTNALIDAKRAAFRTGANPGRGIVDEGLVAPTLGKLADKIDAAKKQVGAQIGQVLGLMPKANTVRVDVMPLIDAPIQKAQKALQMIGDNAGVARLDAMRANIIDHFTQAGTSASAATAREVFVAKKILDDSINHASAEGVEASAKTVARVIRRSFARAVSDAVPEIAPLNQRYADLAEAADAIGDKMNASHGVGDFLKRPINMTLGAMTGLYSHNPATVAATLAGKAVLTSTPAMTGAAQGLKAAGSVAGQKIGARLGGAAVSGMTAPELTNVLQGGGLSSGLSSLMNEPSTDNDAALKQMNAPKQTEAENNWLFQHVPQ